MFSSFCCTRRGLMTVTLCNAADITVALHVYTTTTISRSSADNTDSDQPLSDTVTVDALRACSMDQVVLYNRYRTTCMDVRYVTVAVTRRAERHCRQPRQTASMYYQLTVRRRSTLYVSQSEPRPWPRKFTVLL